jgi:hypothetical protein
MSLINDALKRAKEAQRTAPLPASNLQFRPVEPAQTAARRPGILLPVGIILFVLIGLFLVWQFRPKTAAPMLPGVETKPVAVVSSVPETKPQPASPIQAAAVPAPEKPVEQAVVAIPPPVAVAPPPAPAPLKLQAIIYSPGHSSAIISGKSVWAGDTFRGFRVAAITQSSATLVSASETNVLELDQ